MHHSGADLRPRPATLVHDTIGSDQFSNRVPHKLSARSAIQIHPNRSLNVQSRGEHSFRISTFENTVFNEFPVCIHRILPYPGRKSILPKSLEPLV